MSTIPTCIEAEVAPIEDEKDEDEKVEEVWKWNNYSWSLMQDCRLGIFGIFNGHEEHV